VNEELRTLTADADGERLDRFLGRALAEHSRTSLQKLIEEGFVLVNGAPALKPALRLTVGDAVAVRIPPPPPSEVEPEQIPLTIIFENNDLLVIDKPAGMVVHPAAGHQRGTLVGAVLGYAPEVGGVGEIERPGIVHRLDKDTSGLILVAKNAEAQRFLQDAFAERKAEKTYLALVVGHPPTAEGRIETPIGRDPSHRQRMAVVPPSRGRSSVTIFYTREKFKEYTLIEAHPLTGRTHQIRVHLAYIGCPVAGDTVYGKHTSPARSHHPSSPPSPRSRSSPSLIPQPLLPANAGRRGEKEGEAQRQMLHAWRLKITLPNETAPREFEAPLPEDFTGMLEQLRRLG
jgi:23S rRNA pseudouridine1911/1915/1917 synthase